MNSRKDDYKSLKEKMDKIKEKEAQLQSELDTAKAKYSELLELHKGTFEDLVLFETIITQIRCQLTISPKFALYVF